MKVYVINLDNSVSRWEKISLDLTHIGASYARIPAIYGKSIDWQSVSNDAYCRSYMGRSIQPGDVGCFLSHVAALKEFLSQSEEFAIVLEDDADISKDLLGVANQILMQLKGIDFYAVNLGPSDYKYTSVIQKLDAFTLHCTHRFPMLATGVLWSRAGAQAFLNQFQSVTLPYDNYLRVFLTGTNKAYSVAPAIVTPADFVSDIDTEGLTQKRSHLNRSNLYFFIKQKRMLTEKCQAIVSMIRFKLSITAPVIFKEK